MTNTVEKYGIVSDLSEEKMNEYVYNILGFEIPIIYNKQQKYFNDFASESAFSSGIKGDLVRLDQVIYIGLENVKSKIKNDQFVPNRLSKMVLENPNIVFTEDDVDMLRGEILRCISACLVHECGHIITLRDLYNRSSDASEYARLLDQNRAGYLKLLETNPVTDLESQLAFSKLYYNLPLERMANERMGLTYMDI